MDVSRVEGARVRQVIQMAESRDDRTGVGDADGRSVRDPFVGLCGGGNDHILYLSFVFRGAYLFKSVLGK